MRGREIFAKVLRGDKTFSGRQGWKGSGGWKSMSAVSANGSLGAVDGPGCQGILQGVPELGKKKPHVAHDDSFTNVRVPEVNDDEGH